MDREVSESGAQPVRAVQELLVPSVVPARIQARQLVGQTPVRVQEPRLLALPLAGPARVLRLRLGVQGVQAVGVVDVGVRILRLGVDRLVGRGEVGGLEIGIRGMGQRRGARVGRLTYSAQLGQPCRPVAGAVVTVLEERERKAKNKSGVGLQLSPLNPLGGTAWETAPSRRQAAEMSSKMFPLESTPEVKRALPKTQDMRLRE